MIRIKRASELSADVILSRAGQSANEAVEKAVAEIVADVREGGDAAVLKYCERFDGVRPEPMLVPAEEIEAAYKSEDPEFIETLELAKRNIEQFHRRQLREGFEFAGEEGVILGQRVLPLERVGLYIPGGTAAYPSSVLMNAVPAKLAGVKELIMVTPPARDSVAGNSILAAAYVAGVDKVYRIGGAQAVAALAFGTETVPQVDKIVGPGNIFVATAKRMVFGVVDIDMIAGPSEILVVADAASDPVCLAADLLSQAEHGELSQAVLVCDSMELAVAVQAELERQLSLLPREKIARASIDDFGLICVAEDLYEAIDIANAIAPEHLELCVDDPFPLLDRVRCAGSVFVGRNAPEALGDYLAGPNHVLPTGGTARFSSPLSVDDFVKKFSYVSYTKDALGRVREHVARFARKEGLEAHARSVLCRFGEGGL